MNINRVFRAVEAAHSVSNHYQIEEVQIHTAGYAEPGYSGDIIATGNWNDITKYENGKHHVIDDTPSRLAKVLETLGVELEWSDEWCACSDCGKLVRTQADSYSWTASYYLGDGELICIDCVEEDPEGYFEYLKGNYNTANTILSSATLIKHGYERLDEDYENGLYGGQTDNPQNIAKALEKLGVEKFIFHIDSVGQFETRFCVYVHEDDIDKVDEHFNPEPGVDPADVLKQNLSEMTTAMQDLPEGGVKYGYVEDGVGKARSVSHEEFVEGIKK